MKRKISPQIWVTILVLAVIGPFLGVALLTRASTEGVAPRLQAEQAPIVASITGSVGGREFSIECEGWIEGEGPVPTPTEPVPTPTSTYPPEPTPTEPAVPTPTEPVPTPTETAVPTGTPPVPTPTYTVGPSPTPGGGFAKPLQVQAVHYESFKAQMDQLRPLVVIGWAIPYSAAQWDSEVARMERISTANVEELIVVTTWHAIETELPGDAARLHAAGVTSLMLNLEAGMSPADEMSAMTSSNCQVNSVANFARIAEQYGFRSIFAPIRVQADSLSDAAITCMAQAGLDQIALQEQKFIPAACVSTRVAAIQTTLNRYESLGVPDGNVQMMASLCEDGDVYAAAHCPCAVAYHWCHCEAFAQAIEPMIVNLSIWAGNPTDRELLIPFMELLKNLGEE